MEEWAKLDMQLRDWAPRLRDDLQIGAEESNKLATTIAVEVSQLSEEKAQEVRGRSVISLDDRIEELGSFQGFMDQVNALPDVPPVIARAQTALQSYFCFGYLGDTCFRTLRKLLPTKSTAKKCCVFLTDNPVRAFRNAVAHGNWKYNDDFTGLTFWARKGSASDEPMVRFDVSQLDLNFWQALARCVACVTASVLAD